MNALTKNAAGESRSETGRRSWRRKLAFAAAAAALPLVLLLAAEGILRGLGLGGVPPVLVRAGRIGERTWVATDERGVRAFFARGAAVTGSMESQIFVDEKEPGETRIVVIGESAARGYPQPRTLAASSFLEEMLYRSRELPGKRARVLNLGTVAVASHPLVQVTNEALAYSPDLVIVYAGNNEYYGASGVASVHSFGDSTAALDAALFLRRFALVQWLGGLTARDERRPAPSGTVTLMESVVADARIAADDPRRREAARRLETNLRRIVAACRERGVPVIVSTLPANVRDLAPIGLDAPPPVIDPASLGASSVTAAIDTPSPGEAFALARALSRAGRPDEARAAFLKAKDLDPMPWRAPTESNEAIRRVARESGAILADLEEAFFAAGSPEGPGDDLFDDHVHPSLRGQALVAATWLRAMDAIEDASLRPRPAAAAELTASWESLADALGRNPFDDYAVAHRVRSLLATPFFVRSNPEARTRFDAECEERLGAMTPTERAAVARWQSPDAHGGGAALPITAIVAAALLERGESPDQAAALFGIARRQLPRPSASGLEFARGALLAIERSERAGSTTEGAASLAREVVREAETILALFPEAPVSVHATIGTAYRRLGRHAEAIPHFESALAGSSPSERAAIATELADARRLAGTHESTFGSGIR